MSVIFTTRNRAFYDTHSKTVIWDRLRMWRGDKLVIKILEISFYNTHFKTVVNNRLRIYLGGNFVIIDKNNKDGFKRKPPSFRF